MATQKNATITKSRKVTSRWLNNAMRSIGVSTVDSMKSIYPNISEVTTSGTKVAKNIITQLKRQNNVNRIADSISKNKYVQFAGKAYKNALADLQSGNFNNKDRMFGGDEDFDFGFDDNDNDISFGDDDESSSNPVNVNVNTASTDAILGLSKSMQRQTESIVKTSKASMDAYMAVSSASLFQMQKLGDEVSSHLTNINNSLQSLVQFNNENVNKFIDASLGYYEKMGANQDTEIAGMNSKVTASNVLNNKHGGINLTQYKKYVKQQFKNSSIGSMAGLLDDSMIEMAVSNPLGFASQALTSYMIPKLVGTTIENVERTFSKFVPTMLNRLADWADDYSSSATSGLKRFIGSTFGLKSSATTSINAAKITSDPIPFDKETKFAVTTLITKELSEQTSYLRAMATSNVFKGDAKNIKNGAEVFDYETGTYTTKAKAKENILTNIHDTIINTFTSKEFGRALQRGVDSVGDDKSRESLQSTLNELIMAITKSEKNINPLDRSRDSEWNNIKQNLSYNKNNAQNMKILDKLIRQMSVKNPTAFNDLTVSKIFTTQELNNRIKNIEEDPTAYNLYASGLNGVEDIYDEINKSYGYGKENYKNRNKSKFKYVNTAYISEPVKSESSGLLGHLFSQGAQTATSIMNSLMNNDSKGAFNKFTATIAKQFSNLGKSLKDKVLVPMKNMFFGTRDENGYSKDGIFTGLQNGARDMFGEIKHAFTGKEWTDSKGTKHEAIENSLLAGVKGLGQDIKEGIQEKLFGAKGIFDKVKNTLLTGVEGWKESFIGEPIDGKSKEEINKAVREKLGKYSKNISVGGAIGAGIGTLSFGSVLGSLVGGPIAGAALGSAVGILSKNEKFQDMLFGKKDDNGERIGGFISKKTQDFFKEHKKALTGGAAIGAVKAIGTKVLTGKTTGGLLGQVVGGPIAGALFGLATTTVLKSERFHNFLFGNEETGQKGLIKGIKNAFRKGFNKFKYKDDDYDQVYGIEEKALGMSGVGILGGVMASAVLPGGPIFGGLMGLGASMLANGDTFKKLLFGEDFEDEDGKTKHRHGLLGQFGNMLNANLIRPLKTQFTYYLKDAALNLEYTVGDTISETANVLARKTGELMGKIKSRFSDSIGKLGKSVKSALFDPIINMVRRSIVNPLSKAIRGATSIMYNVSKTITLAPFKILGSGINRLNNRMDKKIEKSNKKNYKKALRRGTIDKNTSYKDYLDKIEDEKNRKSFKKAKKAGDIDDDTTYEDYLKQIEKDKDKGLSDGDNRTFRHLLEKRERAELKQNHKEQKIRDKNAKIIAKATKNQYSNDTEEARRAALLKNPRLAKKLNLNVKSEDAVISGSVRGMSDDDIRNANPKNLSEMGRLIQIVQRISGNVENISDHSDEENGTTGQNQERNKKSKKKIKPSSSDLIEYRKLIEEYGEEEAYNKAKELGGGILGAADEWNKYRSKHSAVKPIQSNEMQNVDGLAKFYGMKIKNMWNRLHGKPINEENSEEPENGGEGFGARTIHINNRGGRGLISTIKSKISETGSKAKNKAKLLKDKAADKLKKTKENGITALERKQAKEKDKQQATLEEIAANTKATTKATQEYNIEWGKIFSKKGLITAGIITLAPILLKFVSFVVKNLGGVISKIASTIGGFVSSSVKDIAWTDSNNARKDGDSAGDRIEATVSNVSESVEKFADGNFIDAAKTFITNEDGEYDNQSYKKTKFLLTRPAAFAKKHPKIANAVKSGAGKAKNIAKNASTITSATINRSADDGVISKAMNAINKFVDWIKTKVAKKFPNLGSSKIATSLSKVVAKLKGGINKMAPKLAPKLTKFFGTTAALASTVVGLAVKESTWVTLGAINGVTGAAKLFYVNSDYVDGKMRVISGIIGALAGTTLGSLVDIVNSVSADVLGLDFIHELAVAIYKLIASDKNDAKLDKGIEEFKDEYKDYQENAIKEAYDQKLADGSIDPNMSYEEFVSAVQNGEIEVDYMSFTEYNDKQHRNFTQKVGDFFSAGWNGIKKGASAAWGGIKKGASTTWNGIKKGASWVGNKIASGASAAWGGIKKGASWVGEKVSNGATVVKETASDIWGNVKDKFSNLTDKIGNIFSGIKNKFTDVTSGIKNVFSGVKNKFVNVAKGIKGVFSGIKDKFTGIVDGIKNAFKGFWSNIKEGASAAWDFITGGGKGNGKDDESKQGGGRGDSLNGFTYYSQSDSRWGSNAYNDGQDSATMADSGCGPTAMSMIASEMTGHKVAPTEMASLARATGNRDETGTNWNFIDTAANTYGINTTEQYNPSAEFISDQLSQGKPMILSGTSGGNGSGSPYTPAGHYVVANRGGNGKAFISDPRGRGYSKEYPISKIANETNAAWSFGGSKGNGKVRKSRGGRGNWLDTLGKWTKQVANNISNALITGKLEANYDFTEKSNDTASASDVTKGKNATKNIKAGKKIVFIGDSRTVGMATSLGLKMPNNDGGTARSNNLTFIGKVSQGFKWFSESAIFEAKKYIDKDTTVLIWFGVNDLNNASNYANLVNRDLGGTAASVFYVSVGPCAGAYTNLNSQIESFNKKLESLLSNKIGWVDIYDYIRNNLKSNKFSSPDGLHYSSSTYVDIFQKICSTIGLGGGKGVGFVTKLKNKLFGGGFGNSPYTSAGHYVVATGIDENGKVNISDPRGRMYSKKYDLNDVTGETGAAWSFDNESGGFGNRQRKSIFKNISLPKIRFGGGFGESNNGFPPLENANYNYFYNKYYNGAISAGIKKDLAKSYADYMGKVEGKRAAAYYESGKGTWESVDYANEQANAAKKTLYDQILSAQKDKYKNEMAATSSAKGIIKDYENITKKIKDYEKNGYTDNTNYEKLLGKRLANFSGPSYNSPVNTCPKGQCTWYAEGRGHEKCGWDGANKSLGNGGDIYENAKNDNRYSTGTTLKSNSLVSIKNSYYGHVMFVEYVDNKKQVVYYTEANSNNDNAVSTDDGILKKMTFDNWNKQNIAGYVYCGPGNEATISEDSDSSGDAEKEESKNVFSFISSFMGEAANKLANGLYTGNFDTDYSSLFSNGSVSASTTTSNDSVTASDNVNVAESLWNYFRNKGYSKAATAALIGNAEAESGLNPSACEGGETNGGGLWQWTPMKDKIKAYAAKKSKKWDAIDTQCKYLEETLPSENWAFMKNPHTYFGSPFVAPPTTVAQWKSAGNVRNATIQFAAGYERPSVQYAHMDRRISSAEKFYNKYKDYSFYGPTKSGGNGGRGSGSGANLTTKNNKIHTPEDKNIKNTNAPHVNYKSKNNFNGGYGSAETFVYNERIKSNNVNNDFINKIINILSDIATNTATSSEKLDLLKNIESNNTTNIITPSSNKKTNENINIISNNNDKSKSKTVSTRNRRIASLIASGGLN